MPAWRAQGDGDAFVYRPSTTRLGHTSCLANLKHRVNFQWYSSRRLQSTWLASHMSSIAIVRSGSGLQMSASCIQHDCIRAPAATREKSDIMRGRVQHPNLPYLSTIIVNGFSSASLQKDCTATGFFALARLLKRTIAGNTTLSSALRQRLAAPKSPFLRQVACLNNPSSESMFRLRHGREMQAKLLSKTVFSTMIPHNLCRYWWGPSGSQLHLSGRSSAFRTPRLIKSRNMI